MAVDWERHRRWADDGTYVRIFAAVRAAAPERDEQLRNLLSIDSTVARANQHAAGALRDAHTGGRSNDTNLATESAGHALGRSRGGMSTKIHALTDEFCCRLTVLLSPGQAGDNPYLKPLLAAHQHGDTEAFRLLADKPQHRRTRFRSAQTMARHRHVLRQARHHLPRRDPPSMTRSGS